MQKTTWQVKFLRTLFLFKNEVQKIKESYVDPEGLEPNNDLCVKTYKDIIKNKSETPFSASIDTVKFDEMQKDYLRTLLSYTLNG